MGPRRFISLPKLLRRPRSKARIGPTEDPMEADPAVCLGPAEPTPELEIGPTTPAIPTPGNREPSGM